MKGGLELHDSRVSHIELADGVAMIWFSHAYVHKSKGTPGRDRGTAWSQEARLVLAEARIWTPVPLLPNTIADGFLEVGGIRHEVIPLPFKRKVGARVHLAFVDGVELELSGRRPFIELSGKPLYLEDF